MAFPPSPSVAFRAWVHGWLFEGALMPASRRGVCRTPNSSVLVQRACEHQRQACSQLMLPEIFPLHLSLNLWEFLVLKVSPSDLLGDAKPGATKSLMQEISQCPTPIDRKEILFLSVQALPLDRCLLSVAAPVSYQAMAVTMGCFPAELHRSADIPAGQFSYAVTGAAICKNAFLTKYPRCRHHWCRLLCW